MSINTNIIYFPKETKRLSILGSSTFDYTIDNDDRESIIYRDKNDNTEYVISLIEFESKIKILSDNHSIKIANITSFPKLWMILSHVMIIVDGSNDDTI